MRDGDVLKAMRTALKDVDEFIDDSNSPEAPRIRRRCGGKQE
jgi:hypothetical protein